MKRKMKKRFFIALVICLSLFNFSHFYSEKSVNNENLNISTIAYASGEDDEYIPDPYNRSYSSRSYSIIDWITNLFVTEEDSIPVNDEQTIVITDEQIKK